MSDNKRIVVIDDEQSVREVVQAYLEKDGYHVFVCLLYTSDAADE